MTHDHYDHIDYKTVCELRYVKKVICPLGVGEHFEYREFLAENITELDWREHQLVSKNIKITATPARHFSSRGLTRNKTLWTSFVIELENWPLMHMFPEQTAQAAKDLNAKVLLPVHWSKFILSVHS